MRTTSLAAADDRRHRPAPGQAGRDSLFFTLLLPEERLWVFLYTWVDGAGQAGRLVLVTDESGGPVVEDAVARVDVGERDFDDWEVRGLRLRHTDPLQKVHVAYEGDGVAIDYTFTGSHEAFGYAQNAIGCPQWMAADRLEQAGRATGSLTLAGRRVAFDGVPMHRDHSWGARDWRMPQHWKWVVAHTPSGLAVNLFQWIARGQVGVNGYVVRDGEPVGLVDARCEATYDADMTNRALRATLVDETGASTEITLERFAHARLPVGSGTIINEAGCHATIDGEAGVGQFEAQWPASYVQHLTGGGLA